MDGVRIPKTLGPLHTHWQVIGDCEATFYCLTKGLRYYVTVDAYNESGVTYGSVTRPI